ncbi:MAG: hypothetical protein DDT33_01545 [Firmicutes bacterium]|nr:hypothetical protein [Bacillota bacterium]
MTEFIPLIGIIVLLAGQLLGFAMWLKGIESKLCHLANDVSHIENNVQRIFERLDAQGQRIARIEGIIEEKQN